MSEQRIAVPNSSLLPAELKEAQQAIELPEIQEMLRQLSRYNLGICMPHMHDNRSGFQVLPDGIVQLEEDLEVSFVSREDAEGLKTIPVAWRWEQDGAKSMAKCVQHCVAVSLQSGGEAHKKMHSS